MEFAFSLFLILFSISTVSGLVQMYIVFQMQRKIHPDRPVFGSQTVREFRAQNPKHLLNRAFWVAVAVTAAAGIGWAFVLFFVLPRFALSSR